MLKKEGDRGFAVVFNSQYWGTINNNTFHLFCTILEWLWILNSYWKWVFILSWWVTLTFDFRFTSVTFWARPVTLTLKSTQRWSCMTSVQSRPILWPLTTSCVSCYGNSSCVPPLTVCLSSKVGKSSFLWIENLGRGTKHFFSVGRGFQN